MSLRVLIVTPWFPHHPTDQAGNFILYSADALSKAGVAVTVLVSRPWTPRIFGVLHSDWIRHPLRKELFDRTLNLQVAHYASIPRSRCNELFGPLFRLGIRRSVLRLVRETEPHLIHAHTETVGYGLTPIALKLGIPLVITLHGINTETRLLNTTWKRKRLRDALYSATRVVLVGEPLRAYFAALAGQDDNFRVVPNGFFLLGPNEGAVSERWREVLRFTSASNLHEGKGIDLNLRAFARLRAAGIENWVYSIIGGGAERTRLEKMTERLGLRNKVRFHGQLPHDSTLQLLADGDVFVLPSYREAFGIAYLEAMASGLLAVGVAGQGPAAFITHGETGLLVQPNDVDSLYENLKLIFENKPAMQRIALSGKRFVRSEFTWARHAEKLIAVYQEALSQRSSSAKATATVNLH